MLHLVTAPLKLVDPAPPEISLRIDRQTLAKRLWRGVAEDGTEFGFELAQPLRHGAIVFRTAASQYVVRQNPEPVLVVSLALAPSAAAGIGWAVGNLHLELSAEPARLIAPDEPAVRQLLARLQVPFESTTAVFQPGRFARGALPSHELGYSHRH
ncbi:MAG TPA: urease accessory protein UreE [Candidatus Synoicihabitans sp.]|nr:urease accessory protein UreE [Candidatus Synoicihabitans sp.]